ncbi:DUF6059 family protein [Streptomyces sp. NPDC047725]|uniref:DUF6059 family protein n=1 Tax=Streptomyces sp. NPDC047725 TaxID=3365487 RepID=UPI0037152043
MTVRRILRRCGRMFLSFGRDVGAGAQIMGALAIGMPPPPGVFAHDPHPRHSPDPESCQDPELPAPAAGAVVGGPAPGHPERLVPHIPPEPEERELWSRLR